MELQKKLSNFSKSWLYTIGIFLIGLGLYFSVLRIGIPAQLVVALLTPDLAFLFLVIVVLLYFVYLPSGWVGILTSFSATLGLFACQLSAVWRSGIDGSHSFSYGGLLSLSDAYYYYLGALQVLNMYDLNGTASYRPLAHGVLASFLGITQQNLQLSIAIIVLITAISCFFLTREIQESHGTITGVLVLAIIFLFDKTWIGTVMTENLGLALGAIGLAIFWRGIVKEKINLCLLGLLLLTLALNTRAGAFFILPALVIWGSWSFRGRTRFSAHFLIGGFSAILLGFVINSLVFRVIASHNAVSNSNFSYTLYGLLVGGRWDTVLKDYPELKHLSTSEKSKKVYELAFAILRDDPLALIRGAFRAWREFIWGDIIFSFVKSAKVNVSLQILALVGVVNSFRQRYTSIGSLIIALLIGILLSIPLVPPWDVGTRVYAATIPIFALFPALGLYWIITKYQWQPLLKVPHNQVSPKLLSIFGIVLALLTFLGPFFIYFLREPYLLPNISCPQALEAVFFRNDSGSLINIVSEQDLERSNVPNLRISDFENSLSKLNKKYTRLAQELTQLPPNTTIFQKINLKNQTMMDLVVDSQLLPHQQGVVAACVRKKPVPLLSDKQEIGYHNLYYAESMKLLYSDE